MQNRAKDKSSSRVEVPSAPKSFSPQERDSNKISAWDQLSDLKQPASPRNPNNDPEQLIALARNSIRARRIRKGSLPGEMFGEPAWDMLLTLYVGSQSGARQTVSNLSRSSGSSPTTALRWIDYLEGQAFVARRASPTDRRITYVDLTDAGRNAVEEYFATLLAEGVIST
jgi:DNA-binding MarR family transcriptional regulator